MLKRLQLLTACLLAAAAFAVGTPVHAQTVWGQIKDMVSKAPIIDASVVLVDDNGQIKRGALTEMDGSFVLEAPERGKYSLRVGAAGYLMRNTPNFELGADQEMHMDVLIEAEDATGPPPGFWERMEARSEEGWFLTQEEIESRVANQFTQIFEYLPGVEIVPLPGNESLKSLRIRDQSSRNCVPELWVDNRAWGPIDDASDRGPDDTLQPVDVEGIEVYPYLQAVPDQFNTGPQCRCGVFVVWTKRRPKD